LGQDKKDECEEYTAADGLVNVFRGQSFATTPLDHP